MDTVEDIKNELKDLAEFLENGYFTSVSTKQRNLVVELVVMKLKVMSQ